MKFSVGAEYRFPTVVRHQGMVIVLALDENRNIYYRVLALDPAQPDDDKSWSDRKKLGFPDQIRPAGMSLVTVDLKTAERTADAPFQALSDGKHVYLFRQSTDGTLYVDRFVFDPAPQTLNPAWEPRFQRSRKRDIPASRKDTLGAGDMEGEPFFEPTTELTVVKGLQDGRFCVLLLPGRLPSQWRWQIFATNARGEVDSFSIRRSEDGLFDMADVQQTCLKWADAGWRFQTGPAALLYMQQEEAQDEYGRSQRVKRGARVMLSAPVGSSRYALELDGADDYVSLGNPASLQLEGAISIEAWVKAQATDGRREIVAHGDNGVYLRIQDGHYQIGMGDQGASYEIPKEDMDAWTHLAGVYDRERGAWLLFRNGNEVSCQSEPTGAATVEEDWAIGRSFAGQINNVRLWNVARTQGEIRQDMHRRLARDEPGLVGDWPLDEGSGDRVYDRVHRNRGQLCVGLALELDGVDDYVELPHLNPDYANGFTVEAWVRYRSLPRWSRIIDFGNGAPQDNIVFANRETSNDLVFQVYGDGAWTTITAPGALELGTWMHLAATVDRDGNAALYKNGQLLVTGTVHLPAALNRTQNYMGRSNWAQDGYFDGGMRQVRVWNIARSPDDIQATMNERLRGDESGLVGDWPLDEGSGVTIHDQAAGHDGQLYVSCGNALDFDGVDDYVSILPMNLSAYNAMSIEAWVKPGDISTNRYYEIIRQEDVGPKPDWLLAFQEHGTILSFGLFAGGSYQELDVEIQPTDYADGQWHHIAATYDGRVQRLYRDGREIGSKDKTGIIRFSPNAVHSIGSWKGKAEFFEGQTGQVCLWSVVRTPQDIQQDMSKYLTGDESGLAACWSPGAGTGKRIQDLVSDTEGRLEIGSGDNLERKWVQAPLPADVRANWVARDNPDEKWVALAPIAILDFGVSRDGTLALVGELEDRSEIALALNGAGAAATLPIPVVAADAAKAAVPMPTIAVDKMGLTVSAGLLSFARSGDTPFLLDGADGLIHLYFRGDYGRFLVAQHDTLTARAEYTLPLDGTGATEDGPRLRFTAHRSGAQMQGYEIAIADGSDAETCHVTIDGHDRMKETWQDVPRNLEQFMAVLNGVATSDANDPKVREGELVFYEYGSNVQREGVPDLTSGDVPFFGSTLFAIGADNVPEGGAPILVGNVQTSQVQAQPGQDCAWIPEPQGKALQFDGADDNVALPHDKLAIAGDLAVEAWVSVAKGADPRAPLRLINYHSEDAKFALGLIKDGKGDGYKIFAASQDRAVQTADAWVSSGEWAHLAAVYNATNALKLDGQGGYVDCGNDATLDMTKAMTVEAWVTPERGERLQPEVILSKWGSSEEEQSWRLYIDTDHKPCFETRDRQRKVIRVKANLPLAAGRPCHLAGALDASPKNEMALTFDGKDDYVSIPDHVSIDFGTGEDFTVAVWMRPERQQMNIKFGDNDVVEKWSGSGGYPYVIRYFNQTAGANWGTIWAARFDGSENKNNPSVRSKTRINDGVFHHVAFVKRGSHLALYIDGLLEDTAEDTTTGETKNDSPLFIGARGGTSNFFSGQINNVRIWNRALSSKEIGEDMDKPALQVVDEVGNWAFDQLDKQVAALGQVRDQSDHGNDGALKGGLKSSSFIEVDKCRYEQRIWVNGDLQGWRWVSVDDERAHGHVVMNKLIASSKARTLVLDCPANVGDHLLLKDEQVVVKRVNERVDGARNVSYWELEVDRAVNGLAREHRYGAEVHFLKREGNEVAVTTTRVNIGRSASDTGYFKGIVDDVRLWDVGGRDWQIQYYRDQPLPRDAEGLVGDWRFEEGRGRTAIDSKGSNHGRLVHPESGRIAQMWTPAARHARLTLYVNGRPVQTSDEALGPDQYGGYGALDQFTMGALLAMIGEDRTTQQHLSGCIDEVRVWNTVRSPEEIRDNLYRALSGAEEGLAGYWPLDEGTGTSVHDQTGNGQDGTVNERQWVDSTAPIGNEGPEVRNVYGGLEKPGFNKQIAGPPAAVEYSDMQWDEEGTLFGVMKRCYIFQDDALQLVTGFKVGDLALSFIGQVQTAPTLIGYIEGAPPVPSENLTVRGADYVGTSTIELTEAKETTQVYSASRDAGFDMSVEFKAGVHWKTGASAGVGVETKVFESEGKVGVHAYFEHSMGYLSSASKTAGTSKTLTKSLTLSGSWEEAQDYDQNGQLRCLNPEVGLRYLPNNMGYALVKSGTADLFALRLKRTGSLVAFQILPNPDIPEDWNIIMFPLNPKYIKNGTLDGMVGLVADPEYPNAIAGERGSYFKPLEAYALKEQIEREARQIEGYYGSFAKAARPWTGAGGVSSELPGGELGYEWETGRDKRSMANTYVWTADGGFYAEEEQFSSIRQESLGSAYHFLGQAGLYAEAKFAAKFGFFFELDGLFGGHINTTISKSKEEKAAFGLHVNVQGEGRLDRGEGDPDKRPGEYTARPCPGKVDAYRFMTFYLAPKPQNFDQFFEEIVDPEWLNGQGEYSPNVRALREARSRPNEVWRVLHRVTYVSRVPPRFEPTPVEAVPKEVRRPANVAANIGLIQEIERIKRLVPPSPEESHLVILGRAVDRLLFGDAPRTGRGRCELEQIVPWWAGREEGVKREIRQDLMAYLKAFYESDLVAPEIEVEQPRVTKGLQVLYTFGEGMGKAVHDVSGAGQALDLAIEDRAGAARWLPGGLALSGKALLATPERATKLIQAAKAGNELTIEAWVKPANAGQRAAPIVTLSANSRERNFALEQDADLYQVYLRTTKTDDAGTGAALRAGKVATGTLSHLVYTRELSGKARFYLNGVQVGYREAAGGFSKWDDGYRFGLGNELTGDEPWQGELHLVAIYNRALGPQEVEQNHKAGAGTTG